MKAAVKKVEPIISVATEKMPDEHKTAIQNALNAFKTTAQAFADKEWTKKVPPTCKTLREAFVRAGATKGTFVNNDPAGDSRTLFPLQAALGYQASQTLFIGKSNLVVEGVTDFWILSSVSDYLRESSGTALPQELIITPAAGAQRVSYMAALLASQSLDVMILLDDEKAGRYLHKRYRFYAPW